MSRIASAHAFGLLLVVAATAAEAAAPAGPREVIEAVTKQVIVILDDQALSPQEKGTRLEATILEHVNFKIFTRRVLGEMWSQMNGPQQERVEVALQKYVSTYYRLKISDYRKHVMKTGAEEETRGGNVRVIVDMKAIGDSGTHQLEWWLRESGGHWRVFDLAVDGVQVSRNLSEQVRAIANAEGSSGLDLIAVRLEEKAAEMALSKHAQEAPGTRP